jgi:3-hydroxyisobutyrate dehydrogenase-like beta-hydroxyacid dehydrogenase
MEEAKNVAFIGLGIMGWRQAANLAKKGFTLNVWNRTHERAREFAQKYGTQVADTPAQAAEGADITITMVVDAPDVEDVLFGPDGAAKQMRAGSLAIDMSTTSPSAATQIGQKLAAQGVGFVDAPVTGSAPKAEAGTLTIMAAGDQDNFATALPALEAMGELVLHVGPCGHGQMIKLIQNTLTACNIAAVGEAINLAKRADVDVAKLLQVIAKSTGASAALEAKAQPMLDQDFSPQFKLAHMLKDLRHMLNEAQALGAHTQLAETAERLFSSAEANGYGEKDVAAVLTSESARANG